MDTVVWFGGTAGIVGVAIGYLVPPRHRLWAVVIPTAAAVVGGALGTHGTGETAGGWLGAIAAGFQLVGYLIGLTLGGVARGLKRRRPSPRRRIAERDA
jgi:MFS family permease